MKSAKLFMVIFALMFAGTSARAQVPRVVAGWGVDTVTPPWTDLPWHASAREIFRTWSEYLLAHPRQARPTQLWSAEEQRKWRGYDLTAGIAYQGFPATVLDIRPERAGDYDVFIVRTLFANATGATNDIRPIALTRVYAVRENGRWVFANALPRLTRDWPSTTVGPITYVAAPDVVIDRARAAATIAFVDSVATSFGVPRLDSLTYYVASSPEALLRAMGVDWTFGATGGGYAMPWNHLVLSGNPKFLESNRHELIHYVLSPLSAGGRTHGLVNEGFATWLGGTVGRSYDELRAEFAVYVRAHPDVTLDLILEQDSPDRGFYPAGAILMHVVHARRGVEGIKELFRAGRTTDELRSGLVRVLGMSWPEISAEWRRQAER